MDLVVTHEAPDMLSKVILMGTVALGKQSAYFQQIAGKLSFRRWYFGHYHGEIDFKAYGQVFGGSKPKCFSELYQQIILAPSGVADDKGARQYSEIGGSFIWNSMGIGLHNAEI